MKKQNSLCQPQVKSPFRMWFVIVLVDKEHFPISSVLECLRRYGDGKHLAYHKPWFLQEGNSSAGRKDVLQS